jgi:hypothetical protein
MCPVNPAVALGGVVPLGGATVPHSPARPAPRVVRKDTSTVRTEVISLPADESSSWWSRVFSNEPRRPFGARQAALLEKISIGDVVAAKTNAGEITGTVVRNSVAGLSLWSQGSVRKLAAADIQSLKRTCALPLPEAASRTGVVLEQLQNRANHLDFIRSALTHEGQRDARWQAVQQRVTPELTELRRAPDTEAYVRQAADALSARIAAELGVNNVGFHYNLHGGSAWDYTRAGGILITRGDIAVRLGATTDIREQVYFFQTSKTSLYDILDAENPATVFSKGRMGSVLNVFAADHAHFERARAVGGITGSSSISFDFDLAWAKRQPHNHGRNRPVGVPFETYLMPPVQVFHGIPKTLGSLDRVEKTLVMVRWLEANLFG